MGIDRLHLPAQSDQHSNRHNGNDCKYQRVFHQRLPATTARYRRLALVHKAKLTDNIKKVQHINGFTPKVSTDDSKFSCVLILR